jgi:hypothetical protein
MQSQSVRGSARWRSRLAAAVVLTVAARAAQAQQTVPTPPLPPVIAGFHAPAIALASPMDGYVVPQDKAVAVFRFAVAEQSDPIDALSFSVAVDGRDQTSLFQLVGNEAWGQLAPAGSELSVGPHDVWARICSQRGICSVARATVQATTSVTPPGLSPPSVSSNSRGIAGAVKGKINVIDRAVQAAKVLVK